MVNRSKWQDFTLSATVSKPRKQHAKWIELYSQFTCPYNCMVAVELLTTTVKNNKSNECYKHLIKCNGIAPGGGKAEDDLRVSATRKAGAVHTSLAKRGRTEGPVTDATFSLREELTAKDQELTAKGQEVTVLVTENNKLVSRNDTLADRVHSLEERVAEKDGLLENVQGQMEQMRADMDQMRLEIQQLQPLVPLVKRINKELGLAVSVPPAAPIDTYVGRLDGLKKAAGLASAVGKKTEGVQDRIRKERDKYRDKSVRDDRQIDGLLEKDARNERKIDGLAHALESERSKGHSALHPDVARQRRQLLKHVHPDNAPKYAHCTPVQMLEQLTKKVTA